LQQEPELLSRKIIDGYQFLVSMAPETKKENLPTYIKRLSKPPLQITNINNTRD